MDYLIYSVNIEETRIQLINNSLGYCVTVNHESHTYVFVYATLNESLDMMDYLMKQLDERF